MADKQERPSTLISFMLDDLYDDFDPSDYRAVVVLAGLLVTSVVGLSAIIVWAAVR